MRASVAGRSYRTSAVQAWRLLGPEQRVVAVGALLLVISTFGPFSWVEAALILLAVALLALLKRRADGEAFHLPFGDGSVIAGAGAWAALLILTRIGARPLGQTLLALACAALILLAGLRERAKRPPDDLPETRRLPTTPPPPPPPAAA